MQLAFFPRFVAATPTFAPLRPAGMEQRILASPIADEAAERREAAEKANETFLVAMPHHCAVGSGPVQRPPRAAGTDRRKRRGKTR
jgi:hypothetical protein